LLKEKIKPNLQTSAKKKSDETILITDNPTLAQNPSKKRRRKPKQQSLMPNKPSILEESKESVEIIP
jgi:hypothetical protein